MSTSRLCEIERALRALFRDDDMVEVRAFDKSGGRFVSRYPFGAPALARTISNHDLDGRDCYYCCNPTSLSPAASAAEGTKEKDVVRRRWVLLDFDPIRTYKIATEQQYNAALTQAHAARDFLITHGWLGVVLASSGNGIHALIPIDLPVDSGAKQLVKNVQRAIADKFQTPEVEVECFADANRLIRAYGTTNHKAEETDTLKWRKSAIIEAAETPAPITQEMLEDFVAKYASEGAEQKQEPQLPTNGMPGSFTHERLQEKLEAWAEQRSEFAFKPARTSNGPGFQVRCPGDFDGGWGDGAEHTEHVGVNGSAVVWVGDGYPRFRCAHAHCDSGARQGKKSWKHLQEFFETKLFIGGVPVKDVGPSTVAVAGTATPEDESKTWAGEYEKWVKQNSGIRFVGGLTKLKPTWVIDRMIFYGGVNMICAPQGGRKTLLALAIARSVAMPMVEKFQFLGRWVAQHFRTNVPKQMEALIDTDFYYTAHDIPVLYVDRENPESIIAERIEKMGLLGCKDFFYWGNSDETNPTPEPDDPRLLDFARAGGLIIFDSLQDWYGGADENNNSQMALLMRKFTGLARLGAGVIKPHTCATQRSRRKTVARCDCDCCRNRYGRFPNEAGQFS